MLDLVMTNNSSFKSIMLAKEGMSNGIVKGKMYDMVLGVKPALLRVTLPRVIFI